MPGSYPYVSEHTAKYQRIAVCGISKGKKFIDDIRQTCELEVQVWESTFLVPGILCGHGGTEQRENCRIHPASAGRGYHGGPAVIQGVHRPVYGEQEHQGIRKGRFSGGPRKYCGCWTVQCAFRRGRYHCLEGMVHTTGLAGGFDLPVPSQTICPHAKMQLQATSEHKEQR